MKLIGVVICLWFMFVLGQTCAEDDRPKKNPHQCKQLIFHCEYVVYGGDTLRCLPGRHVDFFYPEPLPGPKSYTVIDADSVMDEQGRRVKYNHKNNWQPNFEFQNLTR